VGRPRRYGDAVLRVGEGVRRACGERSRPDRKAHESDHRNGRDRAARQPESDEGAHER
jgi:hypothetical protein